LNLVKYKIGNSIETWFSLKLWNSTIAWRYFYNRKTHASFQNNNYKDCLFIEKGHVRIISGFRNFKANVRVYEWKNKFCIMYF